MGRHVTDQLKMLIFEDFCRSIESVRQGYDPGQAFRDHETRVRHLRQEIEKQAHDPSYAHRHLKLVS